MFFSVKSFIFGKWPREVEEFCVFCLEKFFLSIGECEVGSEVLSNGVHRQRCSSSVPSSIRCLPSPRFPNYSSESLLSSWRLAVCKWVTE